MIYNRLHEGMPLGIDATTRFATGNYTRPLTESELAVDSPYNTRTHTGLPPGPIDSPGLASIEAAAHPSKADYLFYVAEPGACNKLAFSSTEAEFNADVERYNSAREAAGGTRRTPAGNRACLASPSSATPSDTRARRRCTARPWPSRPGEDGATRRSRSPRRLRGRARGMPDEGFVGANVTVPHKGAALSLADELSETAREIGAANTLVFAEGEIRADNTDAERPAASAAGPPAGKRALVLGAGGAARAVVWALLREGAEVAVWNRTELRSQHLCEELGGEPVPGPTRPPSS